MDDYREDKNKDGSGAGIACACKLPLTTAYEIFDRIPKDLPFA